MNIHNNQKYIKQIYIKMIIDKDMTNTYLKSYVGVMLKSYLSI